MTLQITKNPEKIQKICPILKLMDETKKKKTDLSSVTEIKSVHWYM